MVKNLIKNFYIVFLIFNLASCKVYKLNKYNLVNLNKALSIKIDGVECEFCAESAINAILNIDGVIDAKFKNHLQDFNNIEIIIYKENYNKEKFDKKLNKKLKKYNFNLKSIN